MWDVSGASAALQEGFQPGRLLRRALRRVTLRMTPLILHLYLCRVWHLGELLGLAMGSGGSSAGLAGVRGCRRDPPPSPGRRRARLMLAQLDCRWDRAVLGSGHYISPWDISSLWLSKDAAGHAPLARWGWY